MTRSITGSAWSSRDLIMVDFTHGKMGGYEYARRRSVLVKEDIKDAVRAMADDVARRDCDVFWARSPYTVVVRHADDAIMGHYIFTLVTED